MLNSDIIAELLHLNDASSVYTRESLGNILDMCNKMLESETLSAEMRGSIADTDLLDMTTNIENIFVHDYQAPFLFGDISVKAVSVDKALERKTAPNNQKPFDLR